MKMILDYLRLERECVSVDHILTELVDGRLTRADGCCSGPYLLDR